MSEPALNSERPRKGYLAFAFAITAIGVSGGLLYSAMTARPLSEEWRVTFICLAVGTALALAIATGLAAEKRQSSARVSALTLSGLATFFIVASIVLISSISEGDESLSHPYRKVIFKTDQYNMSLAIQNRQPMTYAFHPAVPYQKIWIDFDAEGADIIVRYKDGILATTIKPENSPYGSRRQLSFVPSTTEEHTIEIRMRPQVEQARFQSLTVTQ